MAALHCPQEEVNACLVFLQDKFVELAQKYSLTNATLATLLTNSGKDLKNKTVAAGYTLEDLIEELKEILKHELQLAPVWDDILSVVHLFGLRQEGLIKLAWKILGEEGNKANSPLQKAFLSQKDSKAFFESMATAKDATACPWTAMRNGAFKHLKEPVRAILETVRPKYFRDMHKMVESTRSQDPTTHQGAISIFAGQSKSTKPLDPWRTIQQIPPKSVEAVRNVLWPAKVFQQGRQSAANLQIELNLPGVAPASKPTPQVSNVTSDETEIRNILLEQHTLIGEFITEMPRAQYGNMERFYLLLAPFLQKLQATNQKAMKCPATLG